VLRQHAPSSMPCQHDRFALRGWHMSECAKPHHIVMLRGDLCRVASSRLRASISSQHLFRSRHHSAVLMLCRQKSMCECRRHPARRRRRHPARRRGSAVTHRPTACPQRTGRVPRHRRRPQRRAPSPAPRRSRTRSGRTRSALSPLQHCFLWGIELVLFQCEQSMPRRSRMLNDFMEWPGTGASPNC